MQLYAFLLMMALMMYQSDLDLPAPTDSAYMPWITIAPYLGLAIIGVTACRVGAGIMRRRSDVAHIAVKRTDRAVRMIQWTTLILFYSDCLLTGFRGWLDHQLGTLVLVNDLIALSLPLGVMFILWWAYYPIDRRLRRAAADVQQRQGHVPAPVWSLSTYLVNQVRHNIALMMLPLLLILTWMQTLEKLWPKSGPLAGWETLAVFAGAGAVFLFSPLLIRIAWDTRSISPGPLRERLLDMCRHHGVRVRDLLQWRTGGSMINGAVIGFFRQIRYILLTDALMQQMSEREIEAVMAHELGHIRRHHMIWLAVCAFAVLSALSLIMSLITWALASWVVPAHWLVEYTVTGKSQITVAGQIVLLIGSMLVIAGWVYLFGYASRRFERQADTFAVQHITRADHDTDHIPLEAVDLMSRALQSVATLNHVPVHRKNWRHGSIKWRVDYLYDLVGAPVDHPPIDRTVRWMCAGCLALLIGSISAYALLAPMMPMG